MNEQHNKPLYAENSRAAGIGCSPYAIAILDAMVIVRTVRGHDYVIFRTGHGCIAALHAESCPCKEAGEKCRESK